MTKRSFQGPILVGYDGSDESRDALALAKALASASESSLLLAWIEPTGPLDVPYETVLKPIQDRAEDALDEVARGLREQGFAVRTRVGLVGSAAVGIRELAEDESAALIVVGSSHRGRVGRVLAGTIGTQLLHGAPCPVAIAPRCHSDAGEWRPAMIGVAFDGSAEARAALEEARYLARATQATLKAIAVAEPIRSPHEAQEWLRQARHALGGYFTIGTELAVGEPGAELSRMSEGLDLLVVGSRGHGPVRRVLLGSVSSYLVRHCRCPLILTPRGARVSADPQRRPAIARSALSRE